MSLYNMLQAPIVDQGRQINQENQIYLKLLQKATKAEKLQFVKMDNLNQLNIIKKDK